MTKARPLQRSRGIVRLTAAFTLAATAACALIDNHTNLLEGTALSERASLPLGPVADKPSQIRIDVVWPAFHTVKRQDPPASLHSDDIAAMNIMPDQHVAHEAETIVKTAPAVPSLQEVESDEIRPVDTKPEILKPGDVKRDEARPVETVEEANPSLPPAEEIRATELPAETEAETADAPPDLTDYDTAVNLLRAEGKTPPSRAVHEAIVYGHEVTGTDLLYMLRLGHAESTFRPHLYNPAGGGRGACGLYQFRAASTYLEQIYRHGHKFPKEYQHLNGVLERRTGKKTTTYHFKKGVNAKAVFDACYDPKFAAVLIGFLKHDFKAAINNRVNFGRPVNHTEMYIAYFLGINGGPRLLEIWADAGKRGHLVSRYTGAAARRANPGIFNRVRTVGQFYNLFLKNKGMTLDPFHIEPRDFSNVRVAPAPTNPSTRPG